MPNLTRETAEEILTLPASISLDVGDVPNANTVWYKYTAVGSVIHLSVYAWTNNTLYPLYLPRRVDIYEGESLTPHLYFSGVRNGYYSFLVPLTTGLTYYIKISNTSVTLPAGEAVLELSVQATPNEAAPDGSILVNDDTAGYDRAAILSSTDGTFLRSVAFPPGEYADIMADGTILAENLADASVDLYDANLSLIASIPWPYTTGHVRIRAAGNTFYVLGCAPWSDDGTRVLRTVSKTGVIGATTWDIPTHLDYWDETETDPGIRIFAVSQDETVLYYDHYRYDTDLYYVATYDLVNSTAISDNLFTLPAGASPRSGNGSHITESFTLSDGSIFLATNSPHAVLRYSSAGLLLNTYLFPLLASSDAINRIARGVDDTSFWVWGAAVSPYAESGFWERDIATDTELTHFHVPLFFSGVSGSSGGIPVSQPRFGISSSCPFIILRSLPLSVSASGSASPSMSSSRSASASVSPSLSASASPGPPEIRLIRRLRQSPHVSDEQFWLYVRQFQLDLETGLGTDVVGGIEPQIMLAWSDDGGHTWSDEHWVSAGAQGAYAWRAIWRRLGRSRDRVWRVVMSDPVPWRLLDAYVTLGKGMS